MTKYFETRLDLNTKAWPKLLSFIPWVDCGTQMYGSESINSTIWHTKASIPLYITFTIKINSPQDTEGSFKVPERLLCVGATCPL